MSQQALRPRIGAVSATALAILALAPGSALAHEHRTIDDGKYDIVVGWDSEPPVQGQPNAATVRVSLANAGSIPAGALERVHQADAAIGTVAWPAALSDTAAHLRAQLGQLHEALEADDLGAAQAPSHAAHAVYHQFSSQARAWLAAQGTGETARTATLPGRDMHDQ